ncbi:MAG: radical SAM protein [Methanolinea sp.]|nr:radical SAM protein [Methanolinea sp.]
MKGNLLPAGGCTICQQGAKMVLFITGRCSRTCWYCPLSAQRKGRDDIYANEKKIETVHDAIAVARTMDALGTGVTGGEPLLVIGRVREFCLGLKKEFGEDHHIHLYTGCAPRRDELGLLLGLVDEIRMHPPQDEWQRIGESAFLHSVTLAREMGFSAGFEVPALPGIEGLRDALSALDFLNINELEWGETNADAMRERGMGLADGLHNAVSGARIWAAPLLGHQKVHWCSSQFKDSVQLRKRLIRIARNTARPFDHVTEDGTIIYGVIRDRGRVPQILSRLDREMYEVRDGEIETLWWIVSEYSGEIGGEKCIIERYPDRGIIVEVTPVP